MKLKNAITILIIVIILAAAILAYFIFFNDSESGGEVVLDDDLNNTFFPVSDNVPDDDADTDDDENDFNRSIPRLRQISNVPVAGHTTFERTVQSEDPVFNPETEEEEYEEITETVYRYVERSSSNIYETTDRGLDLTRLTNTTIPKIYEALFTSDGEGVVLRYLDRGGSIETFIASIDRPEEETGEVVEEIDVDEELDEGGEKDSIEEEMGEEVEVYELSGAFLPKNISTITKSPVSDDFFYITQNNNGTRGYTFNWASPAASPAEGNLIFQSDISQWIGEWYANNSINLYTKPTSSLEGFSFSLNSDSGSFNKLFDGVTGLTTKISPGGTKMLVSYSVDSGLNTFVYDFETNETEELSIDTFSDKCVWKNEESLYCAVPNGNLPGNLPDNWYQGVVSFKDNIFYINIEERTVTTVEGLGNNNFDIMDIKLSPNSEYLTFMNKKNLTLWSLDVSI